MRSGSRKEKTNRERKQGGINRGSSKSKQRNEWAVEKLSRLTTRIEMVAGKLEARRRWKFGLDTVELRSAEEELG